MCHSPENAIVEKYADNQNVAQINAITIIAHRVPKEAEVFVPRFNIFYPHKNGYRLNDRIDG